MNILEDTVEKVLTTRYEWIESRVKSLLTPYSLEILEKSKNPRAIMEPMIRASGIEIITSQLPGSFCTEVIIKKHGETKFTQIFDATGQVQ